MSFEVNAGRGRGAHPYSVQTGMVFRVLSLKQGVQVHYLPPSPGCPFGPEPFKRVYMVPTMRNGTTPGSCLLDGEMRNFCLKVGQGLKASAST